nr:MAG: hypothetical protein [Microviridae sp.]
MDTLLIQIFNLANQNPNESLGIFIIGLFIMLLTFSRKKKKL